MRSNGKLCELLSKEYGGWEVEPSSCDTEQDSSATEG
jgi:hypothetical protein